MYILKTVVIAFNIDNLTINDWGHREHHLVSVINDRVHWFVL